MRTECVIMWNAIQDVSAYPTLSFRKNMIPFSWTKGTPWNKSTSASQKAFDSVNHGFLLAKLKSCGIDGAVLSWIKSYLPNHFSIVGKGASGRNKLSVPQIKLSLLSSCTSIQHLRLTINMHIKSKAQSWLWPCRWPRWFGHVCSAKPLPTTHNVKFSKLKVIT